MSGYLKQPNGLYCEVLSGYINKHNLTEQDIITEFVEQAQLRAEEYIKNAKSYGHIIAELNPKYAEANDKRLSEMGFTQPYNELVKYVPRKPIDKQYHDFTTYAKCPSCGTRIESCFGNGLKKCSCGQMLNWD